MKISIITICYNNERDIRATIESVLHQTYDDIEYIIVDGASKDNTLKIINEYSSRISTIISEPDKGLYDAINKGIKRATGDILGLIHGGDRLYNDKVIEEINNHFSTNNIDVMYGNSMIVDSDDKVVRINKSPEFNKIFFRLGWMPSHQSIYIKRDLFERFGYYRLDIGYCSDYEFVLRYFYFNELNVKKLDQFIVKFLMGGVSTKSYLHNVQSGYLLKKCWMINGGTPPTVLLPMKYLQKVPQYINAFIWNLKKDKL